MKKIFKYQFELSHEIEIQMPKDAVFLDMQQQNGKLTLWAIVDIEKEMHTCVLYVFGTGMNFDMVGTLSHLKTIQDGIGNVWHFFSRMTKAA